MPTLAQQAGDELAMGSFEAPISTGLTGFGTSARFGKLPHNSMVFGSKDSMNAPGPGEYFPEAALGFNRSACSGVTASFSQASFPMSGRFSTATRSFSGSAAGDAPAKAPELVRLPPSFGAQPSSRKPSAAAYSMGREKKGSGPHC